MVEFSGELRGVMLPVEATNVLLPNASVAEVITYTDPVPFDGAPDWVLGQINWRGWSVPVYSFSIMTGVVEAEDISKAKFAVFKVLTGHSKMPFLAMVAQGFPRLVTINRQTMTVVDVDETDPLPEGVHAKVVVNGQDAAIPALDFVESTLAGYLS